MTWLESRGPDCAGKVGVFTQDGLALYKKKEDVFVSNFMMGLAFIQTIESGIRPQTQHMFYNGHTKTPHRRKEITIIAFTY